MYGDDYELQVVIDHERLRKILQAAQANDPQGHRAVRRARELAALFISCARGSPYLFSRTLKVN